MRKFDMFITAVCVLFLVKLRWPKNKSLYDIQTITFFYAKPQTQATPKFQNPHFQNEGKYKAFKKNEFKKNNEDIFKTANLASF